MKREKCHFIGIGGIGMSGLARLLLNRNVDVSGSDLGSSYVTEGLIKEGAKVHLGHSSSHIASDMTVIFTTGVEKDNPEYKAAWDLRCPLLHRSDLLVHLMKDYKTLAVAGTHGKTTTSALLASVLVEANADPVFAIGGIIPQYKTNAKDGKGIYFVAEACESDGTFLKYTPFAAIVTNIDFDHMDFYKSKDELLDAFAKFIGHVKHNKNIFWCGDDLYLNKMKPPGISYGFGSQCDLKIVSYLQNEWSTVFSIEFNGKLYENIHLSLIGRHNALNAAAVFGLSLILGVEESFIRKALSNFGGVSRRCEKKGEVQSILFLDDYAHHPTEIKTTLQGIRSAVGEKKLIAVYQPHRYSRTRDCLEMFEKVFDSADEVILTDIYSAGELPIPGLDIQSVIKHIENVNDIPVRYISRSKLIDELPSLLRPHDVLVTLGAGDITSLCGKLIEKFHQKAPAKIKVGIIFGGLSVEHEISLLSARHIADSLKKELYEIEYFGISKKGEWISGAKAQDNLKNGTIIEAEKNKNGILSQQDIQNLLDCDIFFPILHGPFGEDGTIQGFFEILGKAYVGCDHRSAAVCMDKTLTKQIMVLHEVNTSEFVSFNRYEWSTRKEHYLEEIKGKLRVPLFVKPVHLGSSIGVSKVVNFRELEQAVDLVFKVDTDVIVENGYIIREIEFAVLGNDKVEVFPPGEIITDGKVYDYESKYGSQAMKAESKADLPEKIIEEGRELARKAYKSVGCKGMARVDTFLDQTGKFWLNEINPIPGFTKNSLYPKICALNGLSSMDLIDRLIILGLQRKRQQDRALKSD